MKKRFARSEPSGLVGGAWAAADTAPLPLGAGLGGAAADLLEPDAGMAESVREPDASELRASALRQARRLVEFYRITADELTENAAIPVPAAPEEAAAVVKYRHPVTGHTWDGIGAHPAWLRQALLSEGYRVAELRVEPQQADCSF